MNTAIFILIVLMVMFGALAHWLTPAPGAIIPGFLSIGCAFWAIALALVELAIILFKW